MKNPNRFRTKHAVVLATFALSHLAVGQITKTFTWILEDENGNWHNAGNWAVGTDATTVVPSLLEDAAVINNGGIATLDTDIIEVGSILVGGAGGTTLNIKGNNSYYARQILLGIDQTGTINMSSGELILLTQESAAVLEPQLQIGREGGGNATFTQTGGLLSGAGTRLDGSRTDTWIGAFGATGVYNLQGGSAELWNLRVGFANPNGGGTVNHSGGTLTHHGDFSLGWAHINGVYHLSGTGVLLLPGGNDRVRIGATGDAVGHFNQSGGTATIAARFEVGTEGAAKGFYDVSGGVMTINNDLCIGTFGAGTTGTYTQTGGSVTANRLRIGIEGGTVGHVLLNGGTLTTNTLYKENATATGSLSFSGGTIVATGGGDYIYGFPNVTLNSGGGTIDTNNQGINIVPPVVGAGGLTKKGAGYVSLTAKSDYSGPTVIQAGVLRLNVAGGLEPTASLTIPSTGAGLELAYTGTDTVSALIVDGVALPEGTYGALPTVEGNHIGVAYISGTGLLKVVTPPGYSGWASDPAQGLAENERGATLDPDNDGFSNLLEYTLGGNPKVSSTGIAPLVSLAGSDVRVTFNRSALSAADTTVVLQWSTDLQNWPVTNQVPITGSGAITQTIPGTNAANGKLFTRLKVSKP